MLQKCVLFLVMVCFSCQAAQLVFNPVNSSNLLGEKLYLQLHKKEGNLAFSPYSIANLLIMAYYASTDGTKKAFEDVLQVSDNENMTLIQFARLFKQIQDPRFVMSSSIWLQSNAFKNKTEDVISKYYGSVYHNVHFNSSLDAISDEINKWAAGETNGKITNLIGSSNLSPDYQMLLISLMSLKGAWRNPFTKLDTREEPFQLDALKSKNVPMMHMIGEFAYSSSDRFFLVEMPLAIPKGQRREVSLYFLLPKKLEWMLSIEENFSIQTVLQAARGIQKNIMDIALPIFDISELISLNESLEEIGLKAPFMNGANFSKVLKEGNGINKFFHVAPISVNEFGVEAKEVPVKTTFTKKVPKDLIQFSFNRPFLFFAMDKGTGVVLLMGRISEP